MGTGRSAKSAAEAGPTNGGVVEVEQLVVTEVDAEGRLAASVNFDPDAGDAALAAARARLAT